MQAVKDIDIATLMACDFLEQFFTTSRNRAIISISHGNSILSFVNCSNMIFVDYIRFMTSNKREV